MPSGFAVVRRLTGRSLGALEAPGPGRAAWLAAALMVCLISACTGRSGLTVAPGSPIAGNSHVDPEPTVDTPPTINPRSSAAVPAATDEPWLTAPDQASVRSVQFQDANVADPPLDGLPGAVWSRRLP